MKISYIIPTHQYEFFGQLVKPLHDAGVKLSVNTIAKDCDLILCGILPITHEWITPVEDSGKPFVLWHWDLYSFTDYREHRWKRFMELLPRAAEIWSCTHETARELKEKTELDSQVVPAWVDSRELPHEWKTDNFVLYAASSASFGKRIDWAKRACEILGLELKVTVNQRLPRAEYVNQLARCRVYLMTAFEESNGTIPAMEAAACGRAVVVTDLPSSREVFGDTAFRFLPWDFAHLLQVLKDAWYNGPIQGCRTRVLRNYDLSVVSAKVLRRLEAVLERRA